MNRLSISNSKNLFLTIVFLVACGLALVQVFYNFKQVPVDFGNSNFKKMKLPDNSLKTILYLGDSRASADIVPGVLRNKIPGYEPFSIGARGGNVFELLEYVKSFDRKSGLLVICVSPASLFGSFVHDTSEENRNILNLSPAFNGSYFTRIEKKISGTYLNKLKFLYGFSELKNIILYGELSHYFTWDGWESIHFRGADTAYAKAFNFFGYSQKILCNSGNTALITEFKDKFLSYVSLLSSRSKVILVRLPVHPKMKMLEESRYPWFDSYLFETASACSIKYVNNFNGDFTSDNANDLSHLSRYQALRFSETLADTLVLYLNH